MPSFWCASNHMGHKRVCPMSMLSVGSKVDVSCTNYNRDTEEISGISPHLERTSICRMFTSTRETLSRWPEGSKRPKTLCKVHHDDFYQITSKWPDCTVTCAITTLFSIFSIASLFFLFLTTTFTLCLFLQQIHIGKMYFLKWAISFWCFYFLSRYFLIFIPFLCT